MTRRIKALIFHQTYSKECGKYRIKLSEQNEVKCGKNIMGNGRVIKKTEGMLGNWPVNGIRMRKGMKKKQKRVIKEMKEAYVKT